MKPGVHFHREALRLVLVNGSSMLTRAPVAPTLMKQVPVFGSECIEVLGRDPATHPAWKEAAAAQTQASDTRAALVSKFKLRYGKKLDEDIAAEKAAADAARANQRPSLLSVLTSKNVQLDSAVLAAIQKPAVVRSSTPILNSAAAKKSQ
jgi:ribosomal protein L31